MLSGGVAQAANKPVPKDPRTHKVINSNLITLNNKLNDTSFNTYILKYSKKKNSILIKGAWDTARKNGVVINPVLSDAQRASGMGNNTYNEYEFIDVYMKVAPKVKYCLMSSKYELTATYRSELWMSLNLYAEDCASLSEYIFSLPDFAPETILDSPTDSVPVSSTTAKASNTPNPAPGPKDYSPQLKALTTYTIGVNAGPGVYVVRQIGAATACEYALITSVDIGSGVMQKRKYVGTTTVEGNMTGVDHGNLTVRLKNGDVFIPFCDAQLYNGGIANIFYPGTYLVGVNILPGVYQSKYRDCAYTYSTPQTPINMNLIYGNHIHPTFFSGLASPIIIPANANAVFFNSNCIALVRVG